MTLFYILSIVLLLATNTYCQTTESIPQINVLRSYSAEADCFVKDPSSTDQYVDVFYKKENEKEQKIAAYKIVTNEIITYNSLYDNQLEFTAEGKMIINGVQIYEEGYYRCNRLGFNLGEQYKEFQLNVFDEPEVSATKTVDPMNSGSGLVTAAICTAAEGRPDNAVVKWSTESHLHFNQTIKSEQVGSLYTVTSELLIDPNKYYNGQTFKCTVEHPSFAMVPGQTESYKTELIVLNVTYAPATPIINVINDGTALVCEGDGNPTPQIRWEMPIVSQESVIYSKTVDLISPDDPQRANDTYVCVATNGYSPDSNANITTAAANTNVAMVNQSSTGMIVGIIFGGLILIGVIIALIYWFVIRKTDDGEPYAKGKIYKGATVQKYGDDGGFSRPTIQHANESINHNRPPSPNQPPPNEEERESSSEEDEGDDVELAPRPSTRGITSKASINFQKERKRPSTSPRAKARPQYDSPPGYTDPRYEVPPGDEDMNDDRQHLHNDQTPYDEDPDEHLYDRPQDRYPQYYQDEQYPPQDNYDEEYDDEKKPITYATLDERYLGDPNVRRGSSEEHVEYAHIRPAYVV